MERTLNTRSSKINTTRMVDYNYHGKGFVNTYLTIIYKKQIKKNYRHISHNYFGTRFNNN